MHPPIPGLRPVRPYPLSRLVIVTTGLVVALGLTTAAMLTASYQDALREQQVTLRNVAIAFAAQTAGVTQAIDSAAKSAARAVLSPDGQGAAGLDEGLAPAHPYLLRLVLFDADGRVAGSIVPGAAGRDMPSFPAPPAGEAPRHITITDIDRASGRGILNFVHPVRDRAGRRIGAVVAQVDSRRFEQLYNLVELGQGGSVTLLHRDGTMLVRGPSYPEGIGRSMLHTPLFQQQLPRASRGAFEASSPIDGSHGLYGFAVVDGGELVIITGMKRAVALAGWYGRLWTALAFYLLLSAVLGLLAWRVARDTRRQFRLIELVSASEARLGKRFDYLSSIMNAIGAPVWVLDGARRIVLANEAFARLVGRDRDTLPGLEERAVFDGADPERERRYEAVLAHGASLDAAGSLRDGSGETRTVIQLTSRLDSEDGTAHLVNVLTDITERERAEARLAWLAEFDAITGLPNQAQFWRLLEARIAQAASGGRELAAVALVLERLHEIVDLLGHDAGDRALRQVADLLRETCGEGAVAARIRGAEFAFVRDAGDGRNSVERFALELHALMSAPLRVDGRDFFLAPVLGVALFPQDGASADALYRSAQGAASGAGVAVDEAVHFFSSIRHTELGQRLALEAQLRRAVERGAAAPRLPAQGHGARTGRGRLRGAAALDQSGTGRGVARALRADRRSHWPDHPDRRLGARAGLPPDRGMDGPAEPVGEGGGQPIAAPAAPEVPAGHDPPLPGRVRPAAGLPRTRDHRDRPDEPGTGSGPAAARHPRARRRPVDRRLRHRLLEPGIPEALSGIAPEGRPRLRARPRARRGQRRDRALDRQPGAGHEAQGGGRRRGDRGPAGRPARHGLRRVPGLPVQQATGSGGGAGAAGLPCLTLLPYTRSIIRAIPWPTPTHMVHSAKRPPLRCSWYVAVVTRRAPDMPSGWPRAIAPP